MKQNKIVKKIDYLFLFSILFLIFFIIFNYFLRGRILCFFVSFLVSYAAYRIILHLLAKHKNYTLIKKQDAQNILSLKNVLTCNGTEFRLNYLKKVLNGKIIDNCIETYDKIYYINLSKDTLTIYDFEDISKNLLANAKRKYIIAENIDSQLAEIIKTQEEKISIINYTTLYFEYIKDKCKLPEYIFKQKNPTRNTLKSVLKIALSKDKARGYFVNGILIFLFSFLYPFKNYYMIFSLALFVISLICIFQPFKNYWQLISTCFFAKAEYL